MRKTLAACVAVAFAACLVYADPAAWPPPPIEKDCGLYGNLDQDDVGPNTCGPTAATNSLVYLQKQYKGLYDSKLVPDLDGDGVLDYAEEVAVGNDLKGRMHWDPALGTHISWFIYGKQEYMEEKALGLTVYHAETKWDWLPPVPKPGYIEDVYPTWQFIYDELAKCEDVEILLTYWGDGGHYVTLCGFDPRDVNNNGTIEPGEAVLSYVDPLTGLCYSDMSVWLSSGRLEATWTGGGTGGSEGWISGAVAQSPVPDPVTIVFVGSAFFGVVICRVRSRRREAKKAA